MNTNPGLKCDKIKLGYRVEKCSATWERSVDTLQTKVQGKNTPVIFLGSQWLASRGPRDSVYLRPSATDPEIGGAQYWVRRSQIAQTPIVQVELPPRTSRTWCKQPCKEIPAKWQNHLQNISYYYSRVDICYDFPATEEGPKLDWIHAAGGQHRKSELFFASREVTGIRWGRRPGVIVRLYKKPGLEQPNWLLQEWAEENYPTGTIWRLEAEFSRRKIKELAGKNAPAIELCKAWNKVIGPANNAIVTIKNNWWYKAQQAGPKECLQPRDADLPDVRQLIQQAAGCLLSAQRASGMAQKQLLEECEQIMKEKEKPQNVDEIVSRNNTTLRST